MIAPETLTAYDRSRAAGVDRSVLCHAPFVSLNFDQSGRVTACCYNREYVLGTYPAQSVREIWTGAPAVALREAFLRGSEVRGCDGCFDQLRLGNFAGALMRNFDGFSIGRRSRQDAAVDLPIVLEFEIANTCSLECVMCGGHWSSAIRDRRERLPPLRNPYDRAFVDQIEALLPTVAVARFLGGEPFLIPRYHEIWNSMRRLSPGAELSITTSAAVVPDRPRRILDDLRAHIVVSLDGITAPTYEVIRRNARFDQVMTNVESLLAYTRDRDTTLTVACCPMTYNWRELVRLVDFCESKGMRLFFNTVTAPVEASLACLPEAGLEEVIRALDEDSRDRVDTWTAQSQEQWRGLMSQLRGWLEEKRALGWVRDRKALAASVGSDENSSHAGRLPPNVRQMADEVSRSLEDRLAVTAPPQRTLSEDRRLREYLECLLIEHASAQWHQTENGSGASYEARGRIDGHADLQLALDAVQRFVDVVRPLEGHRLTSRLGVFRESVGEEAAALAFRDVYQVFWLLVRLSDQQFAEQLAEYLGTPVATR